MATNNSPLRKLPAAEFNRVYAEYCDETSSTDLDAPKKAVARKDMTMAQWTIKEMKRNKVGYFMIAPFMLVFSLFKSYGNTANNPERMEALNKQFMIDYVCPKCGSTNLTKIDRMNGYLSYSRVHGDTRLNDAKMAEIAERKSM